MSYKIALISLGCAKNLVNSEQMLFLLSEEGYSTLPSPEGADVVIINTCGFIDSAKSEAIEQILELSQLKTEGKLGKIVVTGCLAQRYREEILKELPEVDVLVGVGSFDEIVTAVRAAISGEGEAEYFGDKNAPVEETGRIISTGPGWAYLKIAEGCDNRCAYCAIPDIRGKFRSRRMENIIDEAKGLADVGIKELIIVAQDITRYGLDLYGKRRLSELLRELCKIDGFTWIRLHYLYPDQMEDELIKTIAEEDKIVKYLDIPIQHINNTVLKRMNRRGIGDEIRVLFKRLREEIPGLVLRTSLITGFPGEGEDEFLELCDFLREHRLERTGVFPYSPEEGTKGAEMDDRPDEDVALRRAELIMDIQAGIMDEYNESRLGEEITVFCEGFDSYAECFYGRSYADSPDVDGKVFFKGDGIIGGFVRVRVTDILEGDIIGEVVDDLGEGADR